MSTKHEFVTEIVNGCSCEDAKVDEAQQQLAEVKTNLKKVKSHCKAVKEEMEGAPTQYYKLSLMQFVELLTRGVVRAPNARNALMTLSKKGRSKR